MISLGYIKFGDVPCLSNLIQQIVNPGRRKGSGSVTAFNLQKSVQSLQPALALFTTTIGAAKVVSLGASSE